MTMFWTWWSSALCHTSPSLDSRYGSQCRAGATWAIDFLILRSPAFACVVHRIQGFGRAPGSKPVLTFTGHEFEHDPTLQKVKSLLMGTWLLLRCCSCCCLSRSERVCLSEHGLTPPRVLAASTDLFRGRPATDVCLPGIDHLISFTMVEGRIAMRTYAVQFKKSGSRVPRVALGEMGPHMDLVVRRSQFASPSLSKLARKQARQYVRVQCRVVQLLCCGVVATLGVGGTCACLLTEDRRHTAHVCFSRARSLLRVKPPKVKNVSTDEFDNKVGRVHMLRQDYGNLHTRKLKGLKVRGAIGGAGHAVSHVGCIGA